MSHGIAAATSHRRYGAIDTLPDVTFAGPTNEEVEKLCEKVAANIHVVNNNTRKLEREVRNIGTARDNQILRDSIRVTQLKCNQLVAESLQELQQISGISRGVDRQMKLRIERLQNEMKTAVVAYGNVQKQVADKTRQYVLPAPISPSEEDDKFHLREQEAAYNQQQRQLQMELEFEGGMLEDRLALVKNVEADILNVNDIMRMLSALVHEQREVVDTIEQNTENTLANVENANEELIKASGYVGRRRKTVFCLAIVALVVAIIVLVIILTK